MICRRRPCLATSSEWNYLDARRCRVRVRPRPAPERRSPQRLCFLPYSAPFLTAGTSFLSRQRFLNGSFDVVLLSSLIPFVAEVARAYRGFNVNLRLAPRKSVDGIRQVGAFAVAAVFGVGAETFNRFQAQWRDLCAAGDRRHSTLLILVPSFFESLANTAEKLFGSGIDRAVGFANLHERMQTRRGI